MRLVHSCSEHVVITRAQRALEVRSCSPALGAEGSRPAPALLHCPPVSSCSVLPGAHPTSACSASAPGPPQLSISGDMCRLCSNPSLLASKGQSSVPSEQTQRLALAHQLHTYPKFLDTLLRVNMCQEKPLCAQVTPVWGEC